MAAKFRKGIDLNGQRAVNVSDPSSASDAATKQYVDQLFVGINDLKEPVRGTSTGNLAITALVNGLNHDGVTYSTGDRILLKNQTAGAENGIYIIGASGTGVRSTDADASAEVTKGLAVTVLEGTTKGTGAAQSNPVTYVLTTDSPTLGTTSLTFSPVGAGATTYVAGSGLTESPAGTFNVGTGTGISVAADTVGVDTAVVARIYQSDCAATTNPQTFTHGLGKRPLVQVVELSTGDVVYPDIQITTTDITVDWGSAPTSAQYRVLAVG